MTIQTINPTTGQPINTYNEMSENEITEIIEASYQAYEKWRRLSFENRATYIRRVANELRENSKQYAEIITQEMGKPITLARAEIENCGWVCDYYADHAEGYLKAEIVKTEMSKSYVTFTPLGPIFAIMPWNYPFWQVFRFAAPTLMAGNTVLLKHAPICTGTALTIEKLFVKAGLPANIFRMLILSNEQAAQVIAHPKVAGVTLTGSVSAGKAVGTEAAKHLKKVVLELGGSDPYLILEDADLEQAAEAVVTSRLNNAGQVCIAAKRIIAPRSIQDKLQHLIIEKVQRYQMGDPTDENTKLGPLARKDIRDQVHRQVQESIEQGATLILGGTIPKQQGFYYPPTILSNVKKGMPAFDEEIFGPVVAIVPVDDEKAGIRLANDTSYGLAGAVFTRDIAKGEKIAAEKIEAGSVAVNAYVASDPRLPFGGIKNSGYGRELGVEGIRSFTNIKTIAIK